MIECSPHRGLSYTWRVEFAPELRDEGFSLVSFDLEPFETAQPVDSPVPVEPMVRLTVIDEGFEPGSKVYEGCSAGWPRLLSS